MEKDMVKRFQSSIIEWYLLNGRKFPWRYTYNPYKVLISEILLQQTNADKVVTPYNIIVEKYPSINELSRADIDFLRNIFKELGLFYRADRLLDISAQIIEKYKGIIPNVRDELISIKGIGDYTCNSVLCFGYNKPFAIVDTNIIRVFERVLDFKSNNKRPHTDKRLWEFAQKLLPADKYVDYNYGLLDYGALVCKARNPQCNSCIMADVCRYRVISVEEH